MSPRGASPAVTRPVVIALQPSAARRRTRRSLLHRGPARSSLKLACVGDRITASLDGTVLADRRDST